MQLNFLEQLPVIMVGIVVAGIKYRFATFVTSIVYCVARLMYGFGYMVSPKSRTAGAILQDVALLALMGMAYHSAYTMMD